jgi:serine/threonine protein kinase HipA of HipAB toxin-antitoxin module
LTERTIGNRPIIINSNDEDAKDNADNEDDLDDNSDNEYPKTDDEAEEYILTAIEQRIKANNAIVAEKMV